MCLGTIYWAHIHKMVNGNNKTDARNIGFDNSFIYDEIDLAIDKRKVSFTQLLPKKTIKAFDAWQDNEDKVAY